MKVLKILGIVFGALLLLTGGALLAGSYAAHKGDDAVQRSLQTSGFVGPVPGVITEVDQSQVTATFTDQQGQQRTGTGQGALSKPAKVGEKVSIYYSSDEPSVIVATDVFGGSLSTVAAGLRTGGIVCLVLGALLLLGGIMGLALGRKRPAVLAAGPTAPGYPAPPYVGQPGQFGQPGQPGQPGPPYAPPSYPQGYPPPGGYAQQPPATYNPLGPQQPPPTDPGAPTPR